MADLVIPVRGDLATYRLRVQLQGSTYVLRCLYNTRETKWYADLLDSSDAPIRRGLKLVANFPLLIRVAQMTRPPGEFYLVDATGNDLDPDLADLGDRVQLVYREA